ncbi:MAG: helix-turn-helix domain-containing protein [Planctomycetes bacterium]|nr:helix-turn-helix domain-containing protein [Planctomycetota bacterium]MCH8963385.1 helix-turn-helix domain-containing protein [Planctomycetota bacterium]
MAQQFYSAEEALEKLGLSADELKQLVRDGQLREFRDGGQIKYKGEEVDQLAENLATLSGSLGGTSGDLVLETSDESSMGLTGSDMLTLEEADRTDADAPVIDEQKEDTVITSVGVSVFDDEEGADDVDPGAVTVVADKDKTGSSMSLESLSSSGTVGGSGSGLLDLTRESDDTSLGAELLDEIYTEDKESGMPDMGEATRAGLDAPADEEGETAPELEAPVAASEPVRSPIVVQAGMGAIDTAMGGAMVGALVSMGIAGIAISANMQGVVPSFVQTLYQNMPIFGGVLGGITLVGFFIGFVVGKRGTR